MNILLTGSKGFIGSKLLIELKTKYNDNINITEYDLIDGNDIRDRIKLDKLFESKQFEIIIHLAALAGVRRSEDFPDEYISTNITGVKNLIDCAKKYKVNKFVFYSSSSVLGGGTNLKETDEYNPRGLYAITKVTGELLVKSSGLEYIIIRPFTVYGENGRPDMVIYKWINEIKADRPITFYGDGKTSRGYTHIDDVVNGTIKLIENNCFLNTVHLGGSERIKLFNIYEIFKDVCYDKDFTFKYNRLPIPNGDVIDSLANIQLAKKLINFKPKKQFKNIIKNILNKEL